MPGTTSHSLEEEVLVQGCLSGLLPSIYSRTIIAAIKTAETPLANLLQRYIIYWQLITCRLHTHFIFFTYNLHTDYIQITVLVTCQWLDISEPMCWCTTICSCQQQPSSSHGSRMPHESPSLPCHGVRAILNSAVCPQGHHRDRYNKNRAGQEICKNNETYESICSINLTCWIHTTETLYYVVVCNSKT